jgi:signal transduction histidine kinase
VAARTPSGGLIRNDALVRLVDGLRLPDATALDAAVSAGLSSSGPVSRRLTLSDGRALEVEGWSVPGGRVVAVGDRTEQARMAAVRRQVTGAAARHLQAPVSEIQALGSDLVGQVPVGAVGTVRRIQSAADRMERLVAQLLRGTSNDPRARPLRLRPVGAAGIAYGLGTAFDRQLRDRGLRLETDLPSDLPPVRTDAALVHEILSELIANSATFTPRGGTITLSGRALPGGTVELAVADTGPGIGGDEILGIQERFARGASAAGLPGAGLGLGVASALAERIGGRLVVEAGPEGRARLELPAALAPATAPDEDALSREPAAAS